MYKGLLLQISAFVLFSCKPLKNQNYSNSDLSETGGIEKTDLEKFSINFLAADLESGLFKICDKDIYIECNTGFSLTEDGVVLTVAHAKKSKFGDFEQYEPKVVPLSNFRRADELVFISAATSDDSGRPVEPLRYKADLLMRGSWHSSHSDLAFYKLKNVSSKPEFFPLVVSQNFSNLALIKLARPIRVFVPGFPWPHLSASALNNARVLARRNPTNKDFERISYDFGLVYTTGLIHPAAQHVVALRGDGGSYDSLVETNTYSSGPGYSGAPLVNKDGTVLGIARSAGHTSRFNGLEYNSPPTSTEAVSTLSMEKNFDLSDLKIYYEDQKPAHRSKLEERRKEISKVLKNRASDLVNYLRETVAILRKLRRTVTRVKMKRSLECYVLADNDRNNDLDYNINVDEYEVEVLDYQKSRVKYRSDSRSQQKNFLQFWKTSGWSPWFEVATEDLLAEMKVSTPVDYSVFGKKLRGFAPFLANPKLFESNKDFYFRSADLRNISIPGGLFYSAIAGKHPEGVTESTEKDRWTIQFCNG